MTAIALTGVVQPLVAANEAASAETATVNGESVATVAGVPFRPFIAVVVSDALALKSQPQVGGLFEVVGINATLSAPIVTLSAGPVIELSVAGAFEVAGVDATLSAAVVSFDSGPVVELGVIGALEVAAAL
jgi:hypothetical protein